MSPRAASAEGLAGASGQGLVPGGAGVGQWGASSLKGPRGLCSVCPVDGQQPLRGCGKLHEMMMRSRFIMHEGSGGGASRDTGPLFPACNHLREEGSKQDLSPRV